ncbi:putative membrane protein [Candidatus Campylobacter infans]|uniref:Putative membrane protein n=1 Tax=Candidatus Campylobacter infans TaxID=2561898 RepID=A0A7H9CLP1_9BACT|nr:hypothetical protein [Candidatus Campylobacter infans]QLI05719.1 putative membrane protein [Candidatus Campylobacter infans]
MTKLNVISLNWISFLILFTYTIICFLMHWHFLSKEISDVYFVSNEMNVTMDLNSTLETLITQNKIISPKDYFGIYTSTYSNILMITVALLGTFALLSFVYIRSKINDQMNDRIDEYFKSNEFEDRKNELITQEIKRIVDSKYDDIERRLSSLEGKEDSHRDEYIKIDNSQIKG